MEKNNKERIQICGQLFDYTYHTSTTFSLRSYRHYFAQLTARSPEILAPARMPVAAGKKIEKTEKNVSPRKSGPKFSHMMPAEEGTKREAEVKLHIKPFRKRLIQICIKNLGHLYHHSRKIQILP